MTRKYVARGPASWPAIVFLLSKAPRTRPELVALTGSRYDTCTRIVQLLEAEGLAVVGLRGRMKEWRWAA